MIAIFLACLRTFLRDRAGLAMTLLLPPLVYLMFAAIFGASARGEIDVRVVTFDSVGSPGSLAIGRALEQAYGSRLVTVSSIPDLESAVREGQADAGVLLRVAPDGETRAEVVAVAGRAIAAAAVAGRVDGVVEHARGRAMEAPRVAVRTLGRIGDVQGVYYAGAVSVMFVFFAAMTGAMAGLDDRRSGLQARLSLLANGLAPVLTGRLAWLTAVGVMQALVVFAVALPRLPPLEPWQGVAWLATASLAALAASGLAMALVAWCRTREQAQPLSTFLVLLLAALGGSMAPRFLMPDLFRTLGWATPHAWVVEAYQSILWHGQLGPVVWGGWLVLGACGVFGFGIALKGERRRMRA